MDNDAAFVDYRRGLGAAGLNDYADRLTQLARPSVRLSPDEAAPPHAAGSRLGGMPSLPDSTPWPTHDGVPLSLVAQLNLGELSAYDREGVLPSDGLLLFFYDAASQPWGFDPADRGSFAVVHVPASERAVERTPPPALPAEGNFPSLALTPTAELTFVPWESAAFDVLGATQEQWFAYADVLPETDDTCHRLLGHPDPIQGDMQVECQMASNGIYWGDSSTDDDPRAVELRPGALDWRLLLQVDTVNQINMMWGDGGRLYYWIRDEDLAARRWDRSWLVLQCG